MDITNKVTWGVLGTAEIARTHVIPGMQWAPNCELLGIAGRNPQKVKDFAEMFSIPRIYPDMDALLEDPDIQAVYIPLPNDMHFEWTMRALRANKNVLIEKPIAINAEQARIMFRTAEEHEVLLMEGFAYLHSPYMSSLRMLIRNGEIGEVEYIQSSFIMPEGYPNENRMSKERYGGALYTLGCYNTSQVLWLLNRDPVQVTGRGLYNDDGIDILTNSLLDFGDGLYAALRCGLILGKPGSKSRIDAFDVCGSKGYIRSYVPFNESDELEYMLFRNEKASTVRVYAQQNYALEVEQFGRCILFGEQPLITPDFSIRNMELMDRIRDAITE